MKKRSAKKKWDPYLTTVAKMNSKWIIDLSVWAKMLKFLEENVEETLHDPMQRILKSKRKIHKRKTW